MEEVCAYIMLAGMLAIFVPLAFLPLFTNSKI